MSTVFQGILWFAIGFSAAIVLVRRRARKSANNPIEPTPAPRPTPIPAPTPEPKEWEPAIVAVRKNLDKIFPLLRGVSTSKIDNSQDWSELIVSINNEDLNEMWQDAISRPTLWLTYLQSFGIQKDLTSEFKYISEYDELYSCQNGVKMQVGQTYTVVSPCWIYTDAEKGKIVALKGIVTEKNV